ncbi:L-fucose/L-arabinose isomerase family protein [Chloroflexota bacterium]
MRKLKIGFVPAHREPFEEDWAVEMRHRCLDAFSGMPQIEIIVPDEKLTVGGCVRDDGEAVKVIALFKEKDVDGLIIGTMTFGDEVSALTVASAFRDKPVLLFGTKEGPFTPDGNRRSDSFCGTLSISSGLHRRQIPFMFGGIVFPEEKPFKENVSDFLRVCAISSGFIGAKIGLVGPRPERFETCIFSEDLLMRKFRHRVIPVDLADIMSLANSQKDTPAVKEIVKSIITQADSSAVESTALQTIAGLEYALEQFVTEKGLSAMGVQCWTAMQSIYGISSCYAMGCLTDKGVMTSCEVDIYGALTMLMQYLASLGETVPHFIDWTIKHQEKENVFLAWHCGNAPPSLACREGDISLSYHSILGPSLGIERSMGTGEFQLAPGVVTLSRLQEHDGKFKMLVAEGKIIASAEKLRGSWSWVEVPDLDKLYTTLIKEGFVHHASLIHGDCSRALVSACELLDIEAIVV